MNLVLKGVRVLFITVLVKETFNEINDFFVINGMKIMNTIKTRHRYSKEVYVMIQEIDTLLARITLECTSKEAGEFEV